jgi:hypothetical protein
MTIKKSDFLELVLESVRENLKKDFKNKFSAQDFTAIETICLYIAEENVALAITDDEAKKDYHRKNIKHYESSLASMKAVSEITAYNGIINTVGVVMGAVGIIAVKTML